LTPLFLPHTLNTSMTEIDALRQRHKELEEALTAIDAHPSLTTKEQTERAKLKKEKLAIKDRMALLLAKTS
jgi:hypothetical protein